MTLLVNTRHVVHVYYMLIKELINALYCTFLANRDVLTTESMTHTNIYN